MDDDEYDDEVEDFEPEYEEEEESESDADDKESGDEEGDEPLPVAQPRFLMKDAREIPSYLPKDAIGMNNVVTVEIVANHLRRTSNRLTRYELAEAKSRMAALISQSGVTYIGETKLTDSIEIAGACIYARKCPLILEREIAPRKVERFDINEMILPKSNI